MLFCIVKCLKLGVAKVLKAIKTLIKKNDKL